MRCITTHHDGHGRMENLRVYATDEPATEPPGNSSNHRYEFLVAGIDEDTGGAADLPCGYIQFQRGPFDAPGSTPGTLGSAVLSVMIDHLQGFQKGPLANRETAVAITKLQEAQFWLRARADERAARGALGTMQK